MQSDLQQELVLMMNIDNTANANEQIKILKICSDVLSSDAYVTNFVNELDRIFNQENFSISSELSRIILALLNLNKNVDYYKNVDASRMKYIIYGVLYSYLIKHQTQWLNKQNIGDIRVLFSNSFDLLMVIPETVKIDKATCLSFIAKSCKWFRWLKGSKISI